MYCSTRYPSGVRSLFAPHWWKQARLLKVVQVDQVPEILCRVVIGLGGHGTARPPARLPSLRLLTGV